MLAQVCYAVGGVDPEEYRAYVEEQELLGKSVKLGKGLAGEVLIGRDGPERAGHQDGSYGHDAARISRDEIDTRMALFEQVRRWQQEVPGFEDAYLMSVAPYFGSRGGPCIEGDYTLTTEDMTAGKRFPDVVYIYDHIDWLFWNEGRFGKKASWTDVPYRVMLPKGLNGLLAVGRSASSIPDTLLRSRMAVMHMGEAGGAAAALAVRDGVSPRDIDIRELQKRLLTQGYYLGDSTRLQELKLI